jgi:glycosyltransferase involved in cell wall biosynthesis
VLLPVYNAEVYLSESLESLFRQTYSDFEILAIDDASSDRSPAILADYAKKDRRLRILTQPKNGGLVEALNLGLRSASGRYVIRQDADDRAHPDRIRKSLEHLERNPNTVLLGTWIHRMDASGRILGTQRFPVSDPEIRWQFLFRNPFAHSAVAFDREKALSIGGYATAALHAEDYDLWTRLASLGRLANLPEPLCEYRVHGNSVTGAMEARSASIGAKWLARLTPAEPGIEKVWEKFRSRSPLDGIELEAIRKKLLQLVRTHPELSGYSEKKADADLTWHLFSYFKRRPALLRNPRTFFSFLVRFPTLVAGPGTRWRTA